MSVKFSDLNPRLKNASRGSKTVKGWFIVERAEGFQCLYFRDCEKCLASGWGDAMGQDSVLFPANTVLVACEHEIQ